MLRYSSFSYAPSWRVVGTAVGQRNEVLKVARLYAYLRALATGPRDFSVVAANARRALAEADVARQLKEKVQVFRQRFSATSLTNRSRSKLYVIDQRCEFAQIYAKDRVLGSVPLTDLREWIEGVESGAMVLATLATERQFATR